MIDDQDSEPALRPVSAGALLRQAREQQGVHIAALAASIKVAPRKLDALENDRWSELPDATFTRALAQTVCRTLKIDAKPVLDLLPSLGQSTFDRRSAALNEPLREHMQRGDPAVSGSAIRPMVWAAGGLMVAALGLYFFPRNEGDAGKLTAADAAASAVATAALAPLGVASAASPGAAASAVMTAAPAASAAADAASAAGTGNSAAAVVAAAGTAVEVEPVVATKAPPAGAGAAAATAAANAPAAVPPGQPQLSLSASRAAWVDVRDARGQVLISRTLSAGETVGLEGTPPLRVAIGNAAAVQLVFRGQPFELAARTRENVARFELQ